MSSAPSTKIITKTCKRGFFGWFFLTIFVIYNIIAIWFGWRVGIFGFPDTRADLLGRAMILVVYLLIWLIGAAVLGLFVFLTRGKTVITEVTSR